MPNEVPWRLGPIWTVTDKTNIFTMNKSPYRLMVRYEIAIHFQGKINREKSLSNGFSDEYISFLEHGFPDDWRVKLNELTFV